VDYLFPFIAIAFLALGIIGGMTAMSRFMRGYSGFFIFGPLGGALYLIALLVLTPLFLVAMRQMNDILVLFLFAMAPFAFLGHIMWGVGFFAEIFMKTAGATQLPVEQTFDVGDGLMARGKYADAEAQFRQDLAAEPLNVNAQLRVARAMEADGRCEEAAEELNRALHTAIAEQHDKRLKKEDHQQRILRITFALGDILVTKLDDAPRALTLYRNTLEVLAGVEDAQVLRDRLSALETPDRLSISDAVEKAQPLKIKL
jgi:tetratricopeptide (TPR) repeat protein